MQDTTSPFRPLRDIPGKYHLSIFALCLNRSDLAIISGSAVPLSLKSQCIHAHFCKLAEGTCRGEQIGRDIEMLLDKKFNFILRGYRRIKDEGELIGKWQSHAGSCCISGAYWSVMRHKLTSPHLQEQVFQHVEISALQELIASVIRNRKTCSLQCTLNEKEEDIRNLKRQNYEAACRYCQQIDTLKDDLSLAQYTINKLERQLNLVKYCNDQRTN